MKKLAFHLPHVRILDAHHCEKELHEEFNCRGELHDFFGVIM